MTPFIVEFELNEQDITQIEEKQAEILGKKIFANAGNLDYDFFKAQLKNYFEEIKPIYENAHERSLKYYKSHLNELLSGLKQEAKRYAALAASVERDKAGKITHQLKPIEIENFKRDFKNEIAPYLEMLKESRPQDYEEIISFTDYSYEHRDEFFEEQEALKKNSLTPNSSLKTPSNPLSLISIWEKTNFNYERHGLLQNRISKINLRKNKKHELDPMLDILKIKEKDFVLFMSNFSKIKWLRQSALQLLDIIVITFTESGARDTEVSLPLKTYIEMRGLKDEKEARKQIKEDLESLFNLKFETFKQFIKGKKEDFFNLAIIGSHGIKNGKIFASLDGIFSKLLSYYPIVPIHKGLFKLNSRKNPCAFYFAKKIHEHKFMNSGKKNEDIIAVTTLLEAAQNVMPSYEEVYKDNRDYKGRIINPFERDMDALIEIGMLSEWTYCHRNNVPLTDSELENLDYETFKTLNVKVQWTEYPDQSHRLEIKHKKLETAKKSKEKREQKSTKNKKQ